MNKNLCKRKSNLETILDYEQYTVRRQTESIPQTKEKYTVRNNLIKRRKKSNKEELYAFFSQPG